MTGEEPQADTPTPVRSRDFVKYRAISLGYNAAQIKDPNGTLSFEAFAAGVEMVLDYLQVWDRRSHRSALDDVR